MGYRGLLKRYMSELRALLGSDYVEDLGRRERVSKRELGELRSIAAELNRQRFDEAEDRASQREN